MTEAHSYKFKGVWITKALWLATDLSWMEKCLVAEIDNLDDDERGCTASDVYLANKFQSTPASIANMLCRLRKIGYIKTLSFDGRIRRMRVNPRVKAGLTPLLGQLQPGSEGSSNDAVNSYKEEKKAERKGKFDPCGVLIPDSLNTSEFRQAWGYWISHLQQKRKPPTERSTELQIKKLEAMGVARALAAIEHSITSNYQGLFEPNGTSHNQTTGNRNKGTFSEGKTGKYDEFLARKSKERQLARTKSD